MQTPSHACIESNNQCLVVGSFGGGGFGVAGRAAWVFTVGWVAALVLVLVLMVVVDRIAFCLVVTASRTSP